MAVFPADLSTGLRIAAKVRTQDEADLVRRNLETKVAEWMRLGRGSGALLDVVELGLPAESTCTPSWPAEPTAKPLWPATTTPKPS